MNGRPDPILLGRNVKVHNLLNTMRNAAIVMDTTDEETSSDTECGECGHALDIRNMELAGTYIDPDETMALYLLCCPRCRMLEVQCRWTGVPDWWVKEYAEPKDG